MAMYALCPFFLYEKTKKVGCECGMMTFPSYKHKKRVMTDFCCSWNYEKCKRFQRQTKEYEVKK